VIEKAGGDDGTRTRGLCRDSGPLIRFYNNLQNRGDCQGPHKSFTIEQDTAFCGLSCGLENIALQPEEFPSSEFHLSGCLSSGINFWNSRSTSRLPGTNLLDEWIGDLPLIAEVVASQLAKITCPTAGNTSRTGSNGNLHPPAPDARASAMTARAPAQVAVAV